MCWESTDSQSPRGLGTWKCKSQLRVDVIGIVVADRLGEVLDRRDVTEKGYVNANAECGHLHFGPAAKLIYILYYESRYRRLASSRSSLPPDRM